MCSKAAMGKKRFVALARVSSREQEREGFSLEVQEDALHGYAERNNGEIVRFFRVAETASKAAERKAFKELLDYSKRHAHQLDGILFYKVDRAARNLFDYVELERLESECDIAFISVSQPTENTPAGRMQRRVLASMASFYTEQQSVDVKEGLQRRVESGLFMGMAPYGYRNIRVEGRSLVEIHPDNGPKVKQLFSWFASGSLTLDGLVEKLDEEGVWYKPSRRRFVRSTLYNILRDRSYIGEVNYQGKWYAGVQTPLVDRATFRRVQQKLGEKVYHNHELTYGGELIKCGHCGNTITGELKTKNTKSGTKSYIYYRCARYNTKGHPRVRVREADLERQVFEMFDKIRIEDPSKREWLEQLIRERSRGEQRQSKEDMSGIQRQLTMVHNRQDELLNLRLNKEIEEETYRRKADELRDQEDEIKVRLDRVASKRHEDSDMAVKVFELSQSLRTKWDTANYEAKRRILEIICLNFSLEGATLCYTMRKPFEILSEGLSVQSGRADWI